MLEFIFHIKKASGTVRAIGHISLKFKKILNLWRI